MAPTSLGNKVASRRVHTFIVWWRQKRSVTLPHNNSARNLWAPSAMTCRGSCQVGASSRMVRASSRLRFRDVFCRSALQAYGLLPSTSVYPCDKIVDDNNVAGAVYSTDTLFAEQIPVGAH